jgi:hypothetical protein
MVNVSIPYSKIHRRKELKVTSENKRFCKINFVDGESRRFIYDPVYTDDTSSIGRAIEELSQTNNLIFYVEEKLVIIPMNNVRSIEISPSPSNLPRSIIKARYID